MNKANKYPDEFNEIPNRMSDGDIVFWMKANDINWSFINMFKGFTSIPDETISDWLNISVRSFRNYKKPENRIKENIKEHILLLLSLFKHGNEVFGSIDDFKQWLNSENFYFDGFKPETFLNTVSGIRFIDDNLTGMEYGDNA